MTDGRASTNIRELIHQSDPVYPDKEQQAVRQPVFTRMLLAQCALLLFFLSITLAGFLVSMIAGFFCLGGASLVVSFLLGAE